MERTAARALLCASVCVSTLALPLSISFNLSDASYSVVLGGSTWFESSGYAVRTNSTWFSTSNGALTLASARAISGSGPFGAYTGWAASWDAPGAPSLWQTSVYVYPALSAAVFEQHFPNGLPGSQLTSSASNDVCTAFPTFGPARASLDTDLAYLTFEGGHSPPRVGRWTAGGSPSPSSEGGAMTAWYNASGAALLLSALTDVETQRGLFSASLGDVFAQGFNGALSGVPPGWTSRSILVGGEGLAATFYAWGDLMLQAGGKARTAVGADVSTAYLSAWMDNGAFYYYNTQVNATYEQTVVAWLASLKALGLPVRSVQFDSWWYFKRPSDTALLLWEPMPSVFPDGMSPWPGLPLVLHNRFFANENNYTEMGMFDFIVESTLSLPVDKALFLYIMGKAKAWGMIMYEQDWHDR